MRTKAMLLVVAGAAVFLGGAGFGTVYAGRGHNDHGHHGDHGSDHDRDRGKHHGFDKRMRIGLAISPVPVDVNRRNAKDVALGSYLVNAVGGCNDCHTHPAFQAGGDPFRGEAEAVNTAQFLSGGRQFGPFTSTNLTPDEFGRPGGLTRAEFIYALRSGRDPHDANRILQVMPWSVFGKMTDGDMRAIYAYLSAIPSLPDNPAPGP